MKTATLVLAMCVATLQSVIAADCCCVVVCQHQSDVCSKCEHRGAAGPREEAAPGTDCCKKARHEPVGEKAPEKRCAHLEPSHEVVREAAAPVPAAPDVFLELPVLSVAAPTAAPDRPAGRLCPARGSPPLHLLYSVLLI
jgi:hypothetical protein